MAGLKPRTRTSQATFEPTKKARPTVCRIRTKGNTQSDGESRSQVLNGVASIQVNSGSIGRLARTSYRRRGREWTEDFLNAESGNRQLPISNVQLPNGRIQGRASANCCSIDCWTRS